jgi:CRISPR-associated endonuclease Cas2
MRNKTFYYKGVRVNAFGIPILSNSSKYEDKRPRKGNRNPYYASFATTIAKGAPKNLIVMYDIPHDLKKERDWFRRQLIKFGYIMIQKSVWVGPSPLPKEFLNYTKEINIGDKLRTFKLAKPYNSSIYAMA